MHFYTKDDNLDQIYARYLAQQTLLHGSELCFGIKRTYGTDPETIASLRIHAALLPPSFGQSQHRQRNSR